MESKRFSELIEYYYTWKKYCSDEYRGRNRHISEEVCTNRHISRYVQTDTMYKQCVPTYTVVTHTERCVCVCEVVIQETLCSVYLESAFMILKDWRFQLYYPWILQ